MFKFLFLVLVLGLYGCDNSVTNNSGALPNIEFTGSIWAGNVRYAKVQFVGVDQYGQPQRRSDGTFFGDNYYSDGSGQFNSSIQGAYTGSLIAIASYAEYEETITAATETEIEVTVDRKTQIRCVLPSGCKNEVGGDVAYNEWYDAADDFEMWGALSSVTGLEVFNISPLTHLAAKNAFNLSVSDGSDCDINDLNSCVGTEAVNNIFSPDSIYENNHRLKQFFLLNSGLHVNVAPWYDGIEIIDSVTEVESAKHGLIAMALQKFSTDLDQPSMTTLQWWVDSFLSHDGNFYKDATTDYPAEVDVLNLYSNAVAIALQYESNDIATDALTDAKTVFSSNMPTANDKTELTFVDVVFNEETAEKILAAQALVSDVQTWALDLGAHEYESFFDADIAAEITDIEDEWAQYNQKLTPVMKSFFKPVVKLAEYSLTCIRSGGCDTTHDLHVLNGSIISYDASANQISLVDNTAGTLTLDGNAYDYLSMSLMGVYDDVLGQSDTYKIFSFTGVTIETVEGSIELTSVDGVLPSIAFWLGSSLSAGESPEIVRIDINIPELTLVSAVDAGAAANTVAAAEYQFQTTAFNSTLLGTQDPVQLLTEASPYHFNILSVNIEGKFSGTSEQGDSLDVRFTLNSENADTFYAPDVFPDLEMNIDSTAFKNYARFEGEASDFISNQGGWFTLPANITQADIDSPQVLTGTEGVVFNDRGSYSQWSDDYDLLKELLNLDFSESASLGSLSYPGGETALVIFKTDSTDTVELARQCTRVGEVWGCQAALSVSTLGCGDEYSQDTSSVIEAFNWLKSESCIAQVKIDGRGVYDIDYPNLTDSFADAQEFDITLSEPEYLGIENFYTSLISRFVDGNNEDKPVALLIFNGAAPDLENVTMGFSLTHDYIGGSSSSAIGIDSLIPYGGNSIWLAVGQSSTEQDALIYYIQEGNVTLTVFGFDYSDQENSVNPSHDQPLAVLRYDGQLLGSLRKEGNLYVIRYIDGTWQLL